MDPLQQNAAAEQELSETPQDGERSSPSAEGSQGTEPSPDAATSQNPEATENAEAPNGPDGEEEEGGLSHAEVERDLDELAAKAEKADEYLALAQRTRADFENYRKRAGREAALAQERGVAKLAKELLPAIDNLDRAVQAANNADGATNDSQLTEGVKLVHAELLAALARAGIAAFSPAGEAFDPTLHEAVAQIPQEGTPPGTVIDVYQQGYKLGETVLRPARVLVSA